MALNVVLADDSETIRKVVELVLQPEGFGVTTYRDGAEAMRAITAQPPDLVLADVGLPHVSGISLCRSIKDSAGTAGVPVILLVGAFEPLDEDAVRGSGADDIIIKPFESKELVSKTKALIGGRLSAAVTISPLKTSVQDAAAEEEASLDAELARQWAGAIDEPEKPFIQAEVGGAVAPQQGASAQGDISPGVSASLPEEQSVTDEELAKQWAAAMGEDEEEKGAATDDGAVLNIPEPSGLPNDDLARQWEGSLGPKAAEPAADRAESEPLASSALAAGSASFAEILSVQLDASAQAVQSPVKQSVAEFPLSPDELRVLVRSAVDVALAELLQSERSRIQKEFENTVRKAVKDVAEAILLRELDRSVSAD
ncbi:MAG TPA: response regulator transcription factor [Dissulfurispiraceae bacterium]|nr:response regulator transcription factor [Dissulfurispiraceae bacterium]